MMFSPQERQLRDLSMRPGASNHGDARTNFKDSLFSLFMHTSGLQGRRASVFGLNNPSDGGIHVLIFTSRIRLDFSNHTVVLDAALLPLSDAIMPKLHSSLQTLTSGSEICNIRVNDDELQIWKQMLPSFVECCREWQHRPSCEYVSLARIPLSLKNGESPICSCGNGKLPKEMSSDLPGIISKLAVRAAISPTFAFSLVGYDSSYWGESATEKKGGSCGSCGKGGADGVSLRKCSRCKEASYCSAACQRQDWKSHKTTCVHKS